MNISSMAVKNIKGNLYRYIMYYLSNSFTVAVFFIFLNFILHPAIDSSSIPGGAIAYRGIINSIIACLVIIVLFSFLFVSYSTSIFLKSRGKEFGLLSLFGMAKAQIRKYVLVEGTIIALLSIGTGITVGVILSKLFFMAMEVFINVSLPFYMSLKALGITIVLFFMLFEAINILMLLQIRGKEIVQQLKMNKIPKVIPTFSTWKSVLGVLLLLVGYIVAWNVYGGYVPVAMLPVIAIVTLGTYLVFTQFSIAVANRINNSPKLFYNKTNMIAFSQMIFKLQDTAKVLYTAAILGAITFTATGTIYSLYTETDNLAGLTTTHEMAMVQRGASVDDPQPMDILESVINNHGLKIANIHEVRGIRVKNHTAEKEGLDRRDIVVISNSDYNTIVESTGRKPLKIEENQSVYYYPYVRYNPEGEIDGTIRTWNYDVMEVGLNDFVREYSVIGEVHGLAMALPNLGLFDALVLNDKDFYSYMDKAEIENTLVYKGLIINGWKKSFDASMNIQEALADQQQVRFYSKALPYRELRRSFGLTLFIGFFVAFLFFIASSSIIYFKLFNEIKQDGVEYNILRKIGTTKGEITKIVSKQIGVIFFLPFVVSTLHSFFALKSLSNLLGSSLFVNGLIVMTGYLLCQGLYYIIIRKIYLSRIKAHLV